MDKLDKLDKLDILKEWYYKEEERKESLNNSINLQIGILTALIAAMYFLATNFNFDIKFDEKYWFICLLIISALSWIVSIVFLMLAYHAYHYAYFSSPSFIDDEYEIMKPYYNQHKLRLDEDRISIDSLVKVNVENLLKQSIKINVNINDRKSGFIYKSKMCLFISLISLFISSLFYIFNFINTPKEEIHSVKIVNIWEKKIYHRHLLTTHLG